MSSISTSAVINLVEGSIAKVTGQVVLARKAGACFPGKFLNFLENYGQAW